MNSLGVGRRNPLKPLIQVAICCIGEGEALEADRDDSLVHVEVLLNRANVHPLKATTVAA